MQCGCCKSRCHICFPGRQLGKEEETLLALSISLDLEAKPLPEAPTDFLLGLFGQNKEKTATLELVWGTGILRDISPSSSPILTHGTSAVFKQQHEKLGKGLENGRQALITRPC